MHQVIISIPDETFLALKATPKQAGDELLLAAAAKLYQMGRLSSGAAAAVAGMPWALFLKKLADSGVATFQLTEEELRPEMNPPDIPKGQRQVVVVTGITAAD